MPQPTCPDRPEEARTKVRTRVSSLILQLLMMASVTHLNQFAGEPKRKVRRNHLKRTFPNWPFLLPAMFPTCGSLCRATCPTPWFVLPATCLSCWFLLLVQPSNSARIQLQMTLLQSCLNQRNIQHPTRPTSCLLTEGNDLAPRAMAHLKLKARQNGTKPTGPKRLLPHPLGPPNHLAEAVDQESRKRPPLPTCVLLSIGLPLPRIPTERSPALHI